MGNIILSKGVVTPFVQFNFETGSIESTNKPKYFVSLSHNRTCKQACTFKLTIVYVPDTFSPGQPTSIDNMLITSKNKKVSYQYGYYDWMGIRTPQYCTYVGQLNKYTCDIDVASGTLTYTIEGNSVAVELLNQQTSVDAKHLSNVYKWSPAKIIDICSQTDYTTREFYQLGLYYHKVIQRVDEVVSLQDYQQQGMLDIILGTAKAAKDVNNNDKQTNIDRDGGLVQHSRTKAYDTVNELYQRHIIEDDEYHQYQLDEYALNHAGWTVNQAINDITKRMSNTEVKMYIPFMAYFDDVQHMDSMYGTFYYVPREGDRPSNTFVYEYGNNVKNSDVLSINFTYDGSVALANATASDSISASIDGTGQNIGQNHSTTNVLSLGRNSYATLSGFNEDKFLSERELTQYMLYPFKATMNIMGQIEPSNLLNVVDIIVLINGTRHPTLSGEYTVLSVIDEVNNNGFTTQLELIRKTDTAEYLDKISAYVTNPIDGKASQTQQQITDN